MVATSLSGSIAPDEEMGDFDTPWSLPTKEKVTGALLYELKEDKDLLDSVDEIGSTGSAIRPKDKISWVISKKTQEVDYKPKPSSEFIRIMRKYYMKPIVDGLEKVQPVAKTPQAAVFINQVLSNIQMLDEKSPNDLFLDVLYALYDALAVNDNWTSYESDQYKKAIRVIKKYFEFYPLSQKLAEKAIMELENIGFDTLPFVFESEKSFE